jgi:hypothetical protein
MKNQEYHLQYSQEYLYLIPKYQYIHFIIHKEFLVFF